MPQDEIDLLLQGVPDAPRLRVPKPRKAAPARDAVDELLDGLPDAPKLAHAAAPRLKVPKPPAAPSSSTAWRDLRSFAEGQGFTVTSDVGGKHNPGSLHPVGRAVDVRTKDKTPEEVERLIEAAQAAGYKVRDERTRPAGQREWSAPHVHLEADELDALLSTLPDEQPKDEIDSLLDSLPDDDGEQIERVDSVPGSVMVAPKPPPARPLDGLNPYSTEDRARRDVAAAARVRAVTVPLSRSLADYKDSSELMADAYRHGARALNIDPTYVEEWIKSHPDDLRLINSATGEQHTPADLLGSAVHDERGNAVRLNLGGLSDLERDYKAHRSVASRAVDWATDDTRTAGEKFEDVAAPLVSAAGRVGDLATRPLQAATTALWSLARKHSPTEAGRDAWHEFRTGETNAGAGNWLAEQVKDSETLRGINKNLPGMVGGIVEMITDPGNLIPLGIVARGGAALRGTKALRNVERILSASGNRKAAEFFGRGGRILSIEAAPVDELAAVAGDVPHFKMVLKDASGAEHIIDTSAYYVNGQKPKLVSRKAGEDIEGIGLERDGDTGRVFFEGKPQDFRMEAGGKLEAAPLGGRAVADPVDELLDGLPDVEQSLPLAAEVPKTPRERLEKMARDFRDVVNLTKAIPASFDNPLFGQGAILVGARPSLMPDAVSNAVRSGLSRKRYEAFKKRTVTHPNHPLREDSGLYLGSLADGEEVFGASRYTEKIPGVSAMLRAHEATLDSLRSNSFDLHAAELKAAGVTDPKAYKDIARWVNVASGRGELGRLEPLADVLNLPIFSPRLLASKFNVISPVRYIRMHPAARRIALREMFRATSMLGATMGLAKLAGDKFGADVKVEIDPRAPGFGKIDVGGTSYGLDGGRLRALRVAAQIADAFNKQRRGEYVKEKDRPAALLENYFRAYLSPAGQFAYDWHEGEDFNGEEFKGDWRDLKRLAPFAAKEMYDAYVKAGARGAVKAAPAFVGVGVSTREKFAEPIKPLLSERNQAELDRLGLDLEHLGKKGKTSVFVRPRRSVEGVTGDSITPFGGEKASNGMGMSAEEFAKQLSAELDATLNTEIESPDWETMTDEEKARRLDLLLVNTEKRVFNPVRVGARFAQQEQERQVKERLDRMSGGSSAPVVRRFKL
jgi:hypothetical protein